MLRLRLAGARLAVLGLLAALLGAQPSEAAPSPREIREVEFDDFFKVELEGALPFPPGTGVALISSAQAGVPAQLVEPESADAPILELSDPINLSVMARGDELHAVVLDQGTLTLGGRNPSRFDWRPLGLADPQGMAVEPESGTIFVLEGSGRRIVRIRPGPKGDLDATSILAAGRIDEIPLPYGLDPGRGLAFDPASGRLHLLIPKAKALYELGTDGELLNVREVAGQLWRQPLALACGPSSDGTDDPARTSLFLASTSSTGVAVLTEWSLEAPMVTAAALTETAELIRVIDTSAFSPPSPDPAGVAFDPTEDKLLVTDSEVNEMTIFSGRNAFEVTRFGDVLRTLSTLGFSDEPTGVAVDPDALRVFVSDDTGTRSIYTVELGDDGRLGTKDDNVLSFDTESYGSRDPEGVAYGESTLFWVDGVNSEVYRMVSSDGDFDGRRDSVSHFDTLSIGVEDPEGIEWSPLNGHLYIVGKPDERVAEVTTGGTLVRSIDIAQANPKKPAGLAIAPSSVGSGWSLFVSDRGVDNDSDPRENDGKMYELALPGSVMTVCGNGVREPGEQCDGGDVGSASCGDVGCSGGRPRCTSECTLDFSRCSGCPECGNGVLEYGEQCDGSELAGATCSSLGFYCGSGVGCNGDCTYDTASCIAGACGDEVVQSACGELCDGGALGGETCQSQGWGGGELGCQTGCGDFDVSGCSVCDSDGVCEPGEHCGNCPDDCFSGGAVCGNRVCEVEAGEDCVSCPVDCNGRQSKRKSQRYCCGDGDGDNPISCNDARCTAGGNTCDTTPIPTWCCGDGTCEAEEDSLNCGIDCRR